jgi:transcriptional regulator with XRE-family HTH domain
MDVEKEVQRYLEILEGLIKVENFSIREVERRLDWGKGTLNAIFRGRIELKLRHLFGILDLLGYTPEQFYDLVHRKMPEDTSVAQRILRILDDLGVERAPSPEPAPRALDDAELERRMRAMFNTLYEERQAQESQPGSGGGSRAPGRSRSRR